MTCVRQCDFRLPYPLKSSVLGTLDNEICEKYRRSGVEQILSNLPYLNSRNFRMRKRLGNKHRHSEISEIHYTSYTQVQIEQNQFLRRYMVIG